MVNSTLIDRSTLAGTAQAEIERRGCELLMLSEVARKAFDAASNPNCIMSDLAHLVEQDSTLAGDVLSMANSAAYAPIAPITSLPKAVARLGLGVCKHLILSSSIAAMMRRTSLEDEWVKEQLWRHGYITGQLSVRLNSLLHCGFQGEEFTAGLIHDIGRTLFAATLPSHFPKFDSLSFECEETVIQAELEITGSTHCQLGAWYLRGNQVPEQIASVVEFHHSPSLAPGDRRLVALVAAADDMANFLQRTQSSEGYDLSQNIAVQDLHEAGVRDAEERLRPVCQEVMQAAMDDAMSLSA